MKRLLLLLLVLLAAPSWAATTNFGPEGASCYCGSDDGWNGSLTFATGSLPDNAIINSATLYFEGSWDSAYGNDPGDYGRISDGYNTYEWYRWNSMGNLSQTIHTSAINKTGNTTLTTSCEAYSWHYWFTGTATLAVDYTIPNSLPTTGTVSGFPANFHYGVWFNISATVSDADGYANISYWHLLVNYGVDGSWACYLLLTHNGNYIQLLNDAANNWGAAYTMGSATYPANSQCQLDMANSSWSLSGNNATANLRIRFMPGALVRNPMNSYLWVTDAVGNSGWQGPKQTGYVRTRPKLIVRQ